MIADRDDTPAATLLKAATDAMVDPQALVEAVRDTDGRIVDFVYRELNPAACDYLRRPTAELVGATLTETLPDLVKSGLLARYARCLVTGEPLTIEDFPYFSQRHHNVRWYDLRAARAGADWLSLVWRDVTDRHRSNQLVAESEEHFRLLAENSSDVIAQVRNGVITWVSPSVEAAFGAPLRPEQVLDSLNALFQMEEQGGAYFTIWYGVYELSTRTMCYASAGHPPALALNRDGDTVTATLLSTPGIPIGMFRDGTYTSGRHQVPDGGQILIYSDGAYELPKPEGAEEVLCHNDFVDLCATAAKRPDWSLDALVDRLQALTPDGHFEDDCALVLLRFDADRRA